VRAGKASATALAAAAFRAAHLHLLDAPHIHADTFALALAGLGDVAGLRESAAGSEIVFDVILPLADIEGEELAISAFAEASSRSRGEPWLSYFRPGPLEAAWQLMAGAV
jgi:hypothetical protein